MPIAILLTLALSASAQALTKEQFIQEHRRALLEASQAARAILAAEPEPQFQKALESFDIQLASIQFDPAAPDWLPRMESWHGTVNLYVSSFFTGGAAADEESRQLIEAETWPLYNLNLLERWYPSYFFAEDNPLTPALQEFYRRHPARLRYQKLLWKRRALMTKRFIDGSMPDDVWLDALWLDKRGLCAYFKAKACRDGSLDAEQIARTPEGIVLRKQGQETEKVADPAGPRAPSAPAARAEERPTARAAKPALRSDVDKPPFQRPERPRDFAVIVGVEKYSEVVEAPYAERDARAVRDHLLALGLPPRNVVLLEGQKAGYKGIEKFVETWLPRNVDPESTVFFYFSGHGAPDTSSGKPYLLPWDGDPTFLENTGYPVSRLYDKLAALKAKQVLVALDACFSGAGGRSVLPKGARPLVANGAAEAVPAKLSILAAAAQGQITSTRDDQGHGTFTYHLLKGLGAARGPLTTRGLHEYLKPRVQDDARRQNREQTAVHLGGDFELTR